MEHNPEDYRIVDYKGKRHKMEWLLNQFDVQTARKIIFNALEEMDNYGTTEVSFTYLGIRIIKLR